MANYSKKSTIFILFVFYSLLYNYNSKASEFNFYNNTFINSSSGFTAFEGCDYLNNPACISYIDSSLISISVSPLRFGIPELSPAQLFFGKRFDDNISSGVSLNGIGNQLFSEFSGIAYLSYHFGDKLILGASFEYSHLFIKNYSSEGIYLIHFGALLKLNEFLTAGFSMNNILKAYYSGGEKTASQKAVFGLGLKLTESLFLDLDAHVSINNASGFSSALKYNVIDIIALKIAYLTNPAIVEVGFQIKISKNFSLALNANYHNFLGLSQRIMLNYLW